MEAEKSDHASKICIHITGEMYANPASDASTALRKKNMCMTVKAITLLQSEMTFSCSAHNSTHGSLDAKVLMTIILALDRMRTEETRYDGTATIASSVKMSSAVTARHLAICKGISKDAGHRDRR